MAMPWWDNISGFNLSVGEIYLALTIIPLDAMLHQFVDSVNSIESDVTYNSPFFLPL